MPQVLWKVLRHSFIYKIFKALTNEALCKQGKFPLFIWSIFLMMSLAGFYLNHRFLHLRKYYRQRFCASSLFIFVNDIPWNAPLIYIQNFIDGLLGVFWSGGCVIFFITCFILRNAWYTPKRHFLHW